MTDSEELQKKKLQLQADRDQLIANKEATQGEIIKLSEAKRLITGNEKVYDSSAE